jgi:hypothetical protein
MATTWYFHDTNASVGPSAKASTDTDTWPSVPADKNTPKNMDGNAGSAEANDGSNQFPSTTTSARYALGRIFVGPPLQAQTLTGSQAGYRIGHGIYESNGQMNLYARWFVYVWRSGSGNVKTIITPTSCATEHTSKAECLSPSLTGAATNFSILENDRIVVELWFDVRNSKNNTYTATHYYDGSDNTMTDGSAPTASQCGGYFTCPQTLDEVIQPDANVSEEVGFEEAPAGKVGDVKATPEDNLAFEESVTAEIPEAPAAPLDISVQETINFAEGSPAGYLTPFSEYATGSPPGDWTERWNGASGSLNIVEGGDDKYLDAHPTALVGYGFSWDAVGDVQNVEILGLGRCDTASTVSVALIARGKNAPGSRYGYHLYIDGATQNAIRLSKYVNDVYTDSFATAVIAGYVRNDWWWLRFRVNGNSIKAKAWKKGDSEPGAWMIDTTDNDVPDAGWAGGMTYTTANETDFDFFSVGKDGDPAPSPGAAAGIQAQVGTLLIGRPQQANLYWETFENNSPDGTWPGYDVVPTGVTVSGSGIADPNYDVSGGSYPSAWGFQGFRSAAGATENAYYHKDVGSAKAISFITANVKILASSLGAAQTGRILAASDGSNNAQWILYLQNTGSDLRFYLRSYYDGASHYFTSLNAVSIGTTYCVEVKYDTTNDKWAWKIDGVPQPNDVDGSAPITSEGNCSTTILFQRVFAGNVAPAAALDFVLDLIGVGDSEWIGDPALELLGETLRFTESISVDIPPEGPSILVSEVIDFQEVLGPEVDTVLAAISEGIDLQEVITRQIDTVLASVSEAIGFQEALEPQVGALQAACAEGIGFEESVSYLMEGAEAPVAISVSETINFKEGGDNDACTGGTPTASSSYTGYYPKLAFDDNAGYPSAWMASSPPEWLQYAWASGKVIKTLRITAGPAGYNNRSPGDFTLKASDTGVFGGEEVTLLSQTGITWGVSEIKQWDLGNSTPYKYYRLNTTATENGTWVEIFEMELEPDETKPRLVVGDLKQSSQAENINFQEAPAGKVDTVKASVSEGIDLQESIAIETVDQAQPPVAVSVTEGIQFQETIAREIGTLLAQASDAIGLQEAITPSIGTVLASASEAINLNEQPAGKVGDLRRSEELEEDINFQESITRKMGDVLASVSEGINFQEAPAGKVDGLKTTVVEGVNFQESPGISTTSGLEISVEENVNFQESITRQLGALAVSVSETIAFVEEIAGQIGAVLAIVSENINLQEVETRQPGTVLASVSEGIGFAEGPAAPAKLGTVGGTVSEGINFEEQQTRQIGALKTTVTEGINFEEYDRPGMELGVAVAEAVNFQEIVQAKVSDLAVSVQETLDFAESLAGLIDRNVAVSEGLLIQETILGLIGDLKVAIEENLDFGENTAVWAGELFPPVRASIIENINFSESLIAQALYYADRTFKREFSMKREKTDFEIPAVKTSFVIPKEKSDEPY